MGAFQQNPATIRRRLTSEFKTIEKFIGKISFLKDDSSWTWRYLGEPQRLIIPGGSTPLVFESWKPHWCSIHWGNFVIAGSPSLISGPLFLKKTKWKPPHSHACGSKFIWTKRRNDAVLAFTQVPAQKRHTKALIRLTSMNYETNIVDLKGGVAKMLLHWFFEKPFYVVFTQKIFPSQPFRFFPRLALILCTKIQQSLRDHTIPIWIN